MLPRFPWAVVQKSGPQKGHSSVAECRRQSPVFREAKTARFCWAKCLREGGYVKK